jgi:hypothetical protein
MDIQDLFHSPETRLSTFSEMQCHLYRQDVSLQDYFMPLQRAMLTSRRMNSGARRISNKLKNWSICGADKVIRLRPRRKIKTDVLFCPTPYLNRKTENSFLMRTLLGLAQTDAGIVCLLPAEAPFLEELHARLAAEGRTRQVIFIDPSTSMSGIETRLHSRMARMRGRQALETIERILEPYGLWPGGEIGAGFEHVAHFVEAWERMAPWLEFDVVVARCHWNTLCSPVCRTARERGKPVITFQQGVIGHTLDVPVDASKYVAFGESSASFMPKLNERFFQAAGMPQPPVEYVRGGSLFDTIVDLPDQFENRTVLMLDVSTDRGDFYGIEGQCQALRQLAERLLTASLPLRRLVIRPHPYWTDLDLEAWLLLAREHSACCEISHPAWSLEDDLKRSSCAVGVFSGALTVASACGLPTIFLQTPEGYKTGDLACFSPEQTLFPEEAFSEIEKILTDRRAYAAAKKHALRNARKYYLDGANLNLNGEFFERLLRVEPAADPARHNPL